MIPMIDTKSRVFAVTYTKDVRKKQRKQWLDGRLEVDPSTRTGNLFDGEEDGASGMKLAMIDTVPADVSLEEGGGDAFLMRGDGDKGREYLVQVDEVPSTGAGVGASKSSAKVSAAKSGVILAATHFKRPAVLTSAVPTGRQYQVPTKGGKPSLGTNRPVPAQNGSSEAKRRKRSTKEVLDLLGIELKGFRDDSGLCASPSRENRDSNKAEGNLALEKGHNTVEPADRMYNPSTWSKKPVDAILKGQRLRATAGSGKQDADVLRKNVPTRVFDGTLLVCPTAEQSAHPQRTIKIPAAFENSWDYLSTMKKAILEEAYLRIIESTTSAFFGDSKQTMSFNHGQCKLKIWKSRAVASDGEKEKPERVYLHLGTHRVKGSEYHKSDVWLLSNDPRFGEGKIPKATSWTCVVRSLWHGPNKDGKFEVEFVSAMPPYMGNSCTVYALKGPDVSIELDLADLLDRALCESHSPIISNLLYKVSDPVPLGVDDLVHDMPAYNEVAQNFKLNRYQLNALSHVASWHVNPQRSPACLVHGPFGTGKSQLMVAILHLILKLRNSKGGLENSRVMVSSHTNIAVDRVCLGLLESSITDFVRVGALRKVHVDLLGRSLHASESKANASALSELKDMAKGASGVLLEKLKAEMAEVERGAERTRKKLLKTCPIVGVTCVSTALDVLQDQVFDVLLLDEASQLTEPLSLAPIIRSKCKYLIAAGDPNQLPPVVCSPEHIRGDKINSLLRPLFVRLVELGHEPHLLKTQYRCHPDISSVCNKFFYGSKLEDGITQEQRPSMVPSIKDAVIVVDVPGQEEFMHRSVCNEGEARVVGKIVQKLLNHGVPPSDVGVIAFYRAHVGMIKRFIGSAKEGPHSEVQVATVDSFQGAEKRVILLSTATTKASSFASDACRLNVALSRAKNHLFLITNRNLSKSVPCLDFMVRRSQAQGGYFLGGASF
jgi:hypothetical protein